MSVQVSAALAGHKFVHDLDTEDLVVDVLVVARIVRSDTGRTGLFVTHSEGTDGITVTGLLHSARAIDADSWGPEE